MSEPEHSERTKPPLGPTPEKMWREERMWHLVTRLAPFADQPQLEVKDEWLLELKQRITEVVG
jgi:hypothetical protein